MVTATSRLLNSSDSAGLATGTVAQVKSPHSSSASVPGADAETMLQEASFTQHPGD